jgi:hypothetical protein
VEGSDPLRELPIPKESRAASSRVRRGFFRIFPLRFRLLLLPTEHPTMVLGSQLRTFNQLPRRFFKVQGYYYGQRQVHNQTRACDFFSNQSEDMITWSCSWSMASHGMHPCLPTLWR